MNLLTRILVATVATTTVAAAPARAADYDPPIIVNEAPEFVPVEVGNGWYLRGDIGYTFGTEFDSPVDYRIYDGITYTPATFTTSDFDNSFTLGIGVGYIFNRWLRVDGTIEGQKNDFSGTTTSATECVGDPAAPQTTCRSEDSAMARTYSFLANVYGDLGTYAGFTPYVGAGAGVSLVQWDDLSSTTYCVDGTLLCTLPSVRVTTAHAGINSWRFTYALMAGVSYDISRNLKVDVGYKFRHIAGGDMFNFDGASIGAGATGVQGTDNGWMQHEVRVGLRYELW